MNTTAQLKTKTLLPLTLKKKVKKPLVPKKAQVIDLFSVPRPYVAIVYDRKKREVKSYHFKFLDNAVARMTRYALRLEPGTVVELSHAVTSKQIGTIKIHTGGRFTTQGDWALFL